jgi:uncharacterized membrane protein
MALILLSVDSIIPKDFFTLESMLTLTGATGAVVVICNGLQTAFNFNPKWLGLLIAVIISITGVYFSSGSGSDYFIGFINGFLIYATATGTNAVTAKSTGATARGLENYTAAKRSFFSRWW